MPRLASVDWVSHAPLHIWHIPALHPNTSTFQMNRRWPSFSLKTTNYLGSYLNYALLKVWMHASLGHATCHWQWGSLTGPHIPKCNLSLTPRLASLKRPTL